MTVHSNGLKKLVWWCFFPLIILHGETVRGAESGDMMGDLFSSQGLSAYRDYSSFFPNEKVDTLSGNLFLGFPLFSLRQKGGWDLNVSLIYNSKYYDFDKEGNPVLIPQTNLGLGWSIHLGLLKKRDAQNIALFLPDGSRHWFHGNNGKWISEDGWTLVLEGGLYIMRTDSGMKYAFLISGDSTGYYPLMSLEDTYGNKVTLEYDSYSAGDLLGEGCYVASSRMFIKKITDTYGRVIEFKTTLTKLSTIDRGCTFYKFTLDRVTGKRPDGTIAGTYEFSYLDVSGGQRLPYAGLRYNQVQLKSFRQVEENLAWNFTYKLRENTNPFDLEIYEMTTPNLGKTTYGFITRMKGRSFFFCSAEPSKPPVETRSLSSKTVTCYGNECSPATWTYIYQGGMVTELTPENRKIMYVYTFPLTVEDVYKIGCLQAKDICYADTGVLVQRELYEWYPFQIGSPDPDACVAIPWYKPILKSKKIKRGADAAKEYATVYDNFDAYGRPKTITETGDATRTIVKTYWTNTALNLTDENLVLTENIQANSESYTNSYTYNSYGKTLSSKLSGVTTSYAYDTVGNLTKITDANGHQTILGNYEYGFPRDASFGYVNGAAQAGSYSEQKRYDWFGNVLSFKDGEGHETKYTYDYAGRLKKTIPPVGAETWVTYVPHGGYVKTQKAAGTTVYDSFYQMYNSLGQLSGTYDPDTGVCTDASYDQLGRRIFESFPYIGTKPVIDRVPSN